MIVEDMERFMNGEKVEVLNGKGKILIDFPTNYFLAFSENDSFLGVHNTLEEAIEVIKNF